MLCVMICFIVNYDSNGLCTVDCIMLKFDTQKFLISHLFFQHFILIDLKNVRCKRCIFSLSPSLALCSSLHLPCRSVFSGLASVSGTIQIGLRSVTMWLPASSWDQITRCTCVFLPSVTCSKRSCSTHRRRTCRSF